MLVMDGKTYGINDLSSDDAAVMMRSFVKHAVLPPADAYVDMHETGSAEKKEAFTAVWQSYCSAMMRRHSADE